MLRSIKYGLHGAVMAGLIAAPVVWTSVDQSVHLVVDGKASTVTTTAASVGGVLADRKLVASRHDLLAPSASSKVHDGMHVVLRRGRLLQLDIDGTKRQIWTTAQTVDEALSQLGYTTDDFVSVSRSRRLPLGETSIAIRTPRTVTVVHDGKREQLMTTDATVGQLLAHIGVTPGSLDRLSAPMASAISVGQTITVQRVSKKLETRAQALKYGTTRLTDANLAKGTNHVVTSGRNGTAHVTYSVVYIDGKAVGQTRVKSVTVAAPRAQVVKIGTKRSEYGSYNTGAVPNAGTPDPGSAKDIARTLLKGYGWGSGEYDCLVQMWNRESGWRINAANPSGAYGIPQALPGSKMSSAGPNWQSDASTQIKWGLGYIQARYNTPCGAWGFWQAHNYY
ncbi:MAG: ubiquitin-like domain-containing protein [Jatrophihabitans sp.]